MVHLLLDVATVLAASALVVFLVQRVRQPAILGYLLAGAAIGPWGLGLIRDVARIEQIADLGVLLLMFAIGLESSLKRLAPVRHFAIGGGLLQVLLTVVVIALALRAAGSPWHRSIFLGCILAMSSTAIVMRTLQDRGEVDAPHGQVALGMLILQDLAVVPMMIILQEMVRPGGEIVAPALNALAKAAAALAGAVALARWIVPFAFHQIARTRSRELFSIAVLGLALTTALATEAVGLSLALGAFLAGLALGGTDYDHEARAIVGPFRDAFAGVFFVSVGMLLDARFVAAHAGELSLVVALVLLGNSLITFLALVVMRCPVRVAILVAIALSQVGEFGFVIARMGNEAGLFGQEGFQLTIGASVLTMFLTPFMIRLGARVAGTLARAPLVKDRATSGADIPGELAATLDRHAIVCGYGPIGQAIVKGLRANEVPYIVLELNADTVRNARAEGVAIAYADAMQPEILDRAGIERAKAVLVTVPDPIAALAIVKTSRERAPGTTIVARTKFSRAVSELLALGADEVVVEELEAGLEMLVCALRQFEVPRAKIAYQLDDARSVHREHGREIKVRAKTLGEITRVLRRVEVEIIEIAPGSSLAGATVGRVQSDGNGATILAVMRGERTVTAPEPSFQLAGLDRIVVFGGGAQVAAVEELATGMATPPHGIPVPEEVKRPKVVDGNAPPA